MKKLMHSIQTLTGLSLAVYDVQMRCVHFTANGAMFCRMLHRSSFCQELCKQADLTAMQEAKEMHAPCFYTCPFGLFEAVYPIMEQEKLHGYLLISPARRECTAEPRLLVENVRRLAPELNADTLLAYAKAMRYYTEEEWDAVCHTVSIFVEHIASNHLLSASEHPLGELIKQYVRKNIGNKITLTAMSQNLHCSTVTLTETFKREYGLTIMQYVLKKRMQMAEGILSDPNASFTVTEIADRCGFPDVEYFSKKFKETHGVSPSLWRQQHTQTT